MNLPGTSKANSRRRWLVVYECGQKLNVVRTSRIIVAHGQQLTPRCACIELLKLYSTPCVRVVSMRRIAMPKRRVP